MGVDLLYLSIPGVMRGCAGKDDRKAYEDAQGLAGKVQTSGNQLPQFAGLSCKDTGALPWRDAKDFKIRNSSSGQSFKRLWKADKLFAIF